MALGLDLYARYQTVTDWAAVKRHGVGYVWVKLTDGGGKAVYPGDGLVAGARSTGIPVGGYHYAQMSPTPEQQAEVFINEVKRLGATGVVPALDLEEPFSANSAARDFGIRFCRRVLELGYRPGVYMNNAFAKALRPDQWGIPGLVIWLARYGAKPDAVAGRYDVHQYASDGAVPGITGSVDLNESYTNEHLTTQEEDMDDKQAAKLDAVFTQLTGCEDLGDEWGWPSFIDGRKVTPVDYLRYGDQRLDGLARQLAAQQAALGTLTEAVANLHGWDAAQLTATIQQAIADAVVDVNVTIGDKAGDPS